MSDEEFESVPPAIIAGLLGERQEAHDRRVMRARDNTTRIHEFLDGLSVDQLLALRIILNQSGPEETNQFFDGMVVSLLRLIHKVDPESGEDPAKKLLES